MKIKSSQQLEERIKNKTAKLGIVGLGYVGLPLAVAFSQAGFKVLGVDKQQKRVDSVNKGHSYIASIGSDNLSAVIASNLLQATTAQNRLREVDAICICVPTPRNQKKRLVSYFR